MMKNKRIIGISLIFLGIGLLIYSSLSIQGIYLSPGSPYINISLILGLAFVGVGILLGFGEESLEKKLDIINTRKKYTINKDSIIKDVEQDYLLSIEEENEKTHTQERIERIITGGKTIGYKNKRKSYNEQFNEGHAAQGGRVIEVKSHLSKKGETKGKLIHFDQPANARYLWVIDEDENFIIANRQTFVHEMDEMNKDKIDYSHRLHKLPHATLARGKRIYGSGEVLIKGGLIKEINTHSGHYLPVTVTPGKNPGEYQNNLIEKFNNQGIEIFKEFSKKYGWKEVKEGAKYN